MFTAREFTKMGLIRRADMDFRENGNSYKCYTYGDLKVIYTKNSNLCTIRIKVPYDKCNFTYQDARETDWFKFLEGLFDADILTAEDVKKRLDKIKSGVEKLNQDILNDDIDPSILEKNYEEEVKAAKATMKQFSDNFDWIHADENIRQLTTEAYKELDNIVKGTHPDFTKFNFKTRRAMNRIFKINGYCNLDIHRCISILQKAI